MAAERKPGGPVFAEAIPATLKQRPLQEQVFMLAAEITWYREKVRHTADALDGLGRRAALVGDLRLAKAFEDSAQLVRRIDDQSLLDPEVEP